MSEQDVVGCKCDEYPECTHVLYFYMGVKHARAALPELEKLLAELTRLEASWVHDTGSMSQDCTATCYKCSLRRALAELRRGAGR